MSFLIKYLNFLERYNKIWKKVTNVIKKEFDSKPVYNEKYVKNKMRSYNGKIDTNVHNNKIPKEGCQFICLSVILIDSACRKDKNYCPQAFLEEFKYVVKKKDV